MDEQHIPPILPITKIPIKDAKTQKRRIVLAIVGIFGPLIVLWTLVLWGLWSGRITMGPSLPLTKVATELEKYVKSTLQKPKRIITLSTITDFQWDQVYFLEPYAAVAPFVWHTGVLWLRLPFVARPYRESTCIIVFFKKGQLIHYIKLNRGIVDCSSLDGTGYYTPETAIFELESQVAGYYSLKPHR